MLSRDFSDVSPNVKLPGVTFVSNRSLTCNEVDVAWHVIGLNVKGAT